MISDKFFKTKKFKIFILIVVGVVSFTIVSGFTYLKVQANKNIPDISSSTDLQQFTEVDLAQYDGSNPDKPIYIGLNGYVYDVTPGKSYYETGGTYHYLAGKDSSAELNLVGGDIIIKKYKVIGVLI